RWHGHGSSGQGKPPSLRKTSQGWKSSGFWFLALARKDTDGSGISDVPNRRMDSSMVGLALRAAVPPTCGVKRIRTFRQHERLLALPLRLQSGFPTSALHFRPEAGTYVLRHSPGRCKVFSGMNLAMRIGA